MQYCIAWKSLATGVTGIGDYCLTKEVAENYIVKLNIEYIDAFHHWVQHESEELNTDPCTHVT